MARPSSFKKEYCEILIDLMKEGASVVEFCATIGISKQTFYVWLKEHPILVDSYKEGLTYSQAWWEQQGRKNLKTVGFQTGLWSMNMKNRFSDEWKDKHEVDHTTGGEQIKQIKIEIVHTDNNRNEGSE